MDYNPKTPDEFADWRDNLVASQGLDDNLLKDSLKHHLRLGKSGRFYMNEFCGFPVLQTGDDLLQLQNIYWNYKPSFVIETGIARGGSIIFHAYNLALSYLLGLTPIKPNVIGIDILLHQYNRHAIDSSPFSQFITLIEHSSVDHLVLSQLNFLFPNILDSNKVIILDSNHVEEHVYNELVLYSQICTSGDYIVVFDTIVEYLDALDPSSYKDRPWGRGSSPLTAVNRFLKLCPDFYRVEFIDNKLLASGAINGWLRKK